MKTLVMILIAAAALLAGAGLLFYRNVLAGPPQKPDRLDGGSLWDLSTRTLEGEEVPLSLYRGQVALVVNTASKCGLTPQYQGLEALYREFQGRGLVILGFPSNDFMGQEPGSPTEIRAFCDANYRVTFPLFEKVNVKGDQKGEIFAFLTAGGLEDPTWNFTKYLVARDGRVIARFAPRTSPEDPRLREAILAALGD